MKSYRYCCPRCGREVESGWAPAEVKGTRLELCPKCREKMFQYKPTEGTT